MDPCSDRPIFRLQNKDQARSREYASRTHMSKSDCLARLHRDRRGEARGNDTAEEGHRFV